jgi:hypothetical protein
MLIESLVAGLLLSVINPVRSQPSFSGHPEIRVEITTRAGEPLPGTAVSLCPVDAKRPVIPNPSNTSWKACTHAGTDMAGQALFTRIVPGHYAVIADQPGFAIASVYPLSIAASDPIAPDELLIVLNPTCDHCVGHRAH